MSGINEFFKKQSESMFSGGGDRISFFPKPKNGQSAIDIVGRLYFITNDDGDENIPAYTFKTHGWGQTTSVCPRMFDRENYCEICEQSGIAYAAKDNEKGRSLMSKTGYWFCLVPRMKGYEEQPTLMDIPYGATQRIWTALALMGGWKSASIDFADADCAKALEKGIHKCYGNTGHDVIIHFDPNAASKAKWSKERFTDAKAKKLKQDFDPPNFEETFRRVKKLGDNSGPQYTEPSAPPPDFEEMNMTELREFANSNTISLKGLKKKADIISKLQEEV